MEQISTFMIVGFIAQMVDGTLGMAIGAALAAPIAAYACKKAPTRGIMAVVGVVLVILSIRTLSQILK